MKWLEIKFFLLSEEIKILTCEKECCFPPFIFSLHQPETVSTKFQGNEEAEVSLALYSNG